MRAGFLVRGGCVCQQAHCCCGTRGQFIKVLNCGHGTNQPWPLTILVHSTAHVLASTNVSPPRETDVCGVGWSGGPRLAQPVCWEPADRRTPSSHLRKMRMVATGLPSTHWASLGQPHYLVAPQRGQDVPAGEGEAGVVIPLRGFVHPAPLCDDAPIDVVCLDARTGV